MGGQPYIYSSPATYSALDPYNSFDPKAVTRASYAPKPPKPKPQGPLIDFNKHPDSWLVRPYGQTTYEPMRASTKKNVKIARWIQQAFRVMEILCAVGVLFCVICVRNTTFNEGVIIRVPAGIDLLTTTYAIYHLCRAAKNRPPASSASYHFFASFIDGGLIPFYVYIALLSRDKLAESAATEGRWTSILKTPGATDKIMRATALTSVTSASLHGASFFVSVYLLVMFKKISNLPPDMNPLEDNLTSRTKKKHKYKNSDLGSERDLKHLSASTDSAISVSTSERSSTIKERASANVRPISFLHTRDSTERIYSPHNPRTANASRTDLANPQHVYQQSPLSRTSNINFPETGYNGRSGSPSDRSHGIYSQPSSHLPTMTSSVYSGQDTDPNAPPLPRKSSKRESAPSSSENWYIHEDEDAGVSIVDEEDEYDADIAKSSVSALSIDKIRNRSYEPLRNPVDSGFAAPYTRIQNSPSSKDHVKHQGFVLQPLGMNPPTPPPASLRTTRRVLSPTTGNMKTDSGAPGSRGVPPSLGKTKYYGDLKDAVQGIRNGGSPSPNPSPVNSPGKRQRGYGNPQKESGIAVSEWIASSGVARKDFAEPYTSDDRGHDGKGRVISRSGADITDAPYIEDYDGDMLASSGLGYSGKGNRQVSGKMAEEGNAGVGSKGWKGSLSLPRRRISGRIGWRSNR